MSAVPTVNTKAAVVAEQETAKRVADNLPRPNGS
jgi:membrane fusion protein (multidrug efflux system)